MAPRFTLDQIRWCAGAQLLRGEAQAACDQVFTDSRHPIPGALFVALRGERFDGSGFALQALQQGAAAALVPTDAAQALLSQLAREKVAGALFAAPDTGRALAGLAHAWRAQLPQLRVVAITGSTGKTSTKELIASVLEAAGPTLKTEGNLNNEIGVPLTLLSLRESHRFAAIECGMNHLGEIARLAAWADPDVAVVTNVGPVHLEGCGSIEGVAHAKGELFHALRPSGVAVANLDDPRVQAQALLSGRKLITFGQSASADVRLLESHHEGAGLSVTLALPKLPPLTVHLRMIGLHNAQNAAAAAAVGVALDLPVEQIREGLSQAQTPGRRMRPVPLPGGGMLIDDCYNANPASTKAALLTISHLVKSRGRAIAVLGDMLELGPTELELHRDVGRFAAGAGLAQLICFGRRAKAIGEAALQAGMRPSQVQYTEDPAEAVEQVKAQLSADDVVLVKGSRGMKMERISDPLTGAVPLSAQH